jgi:hypothetical protein
MAAALYDALTELATKCCKCPGKAKSYSDIAGIVSKFIREKDMKKKIDILVNKPDAIRK